VLYVDGEAGRDSLNELMSLLGFANIGLLTLCVSRTPSGGLHLIFRLRPGERPRNRARDIGAGLDSRGVKADGTSAGYFIAPGSALPDGRRYQLVDANTLEPIVGDERPFDGASPVCRELHYLATFSAAERTEIARFPDLQLAIRKSEGAEWPAIFERHRARRRSTIKLSLSARPSDSSTSPFQRHRRYAEAALSREIAALATMAPKSGRNDAVFRLACKLGRWVHHGSLARDRLIEHVLNACERNGLVQENGRSAIVATINNGLAKSAGDELPVLGPCHG
jgi:hypothetical protein